MIIFLGDSITEWGNWETLLPEFDIENYGVAGNTTFQIIDRVDELFGKEAHQLFLLVGVNDLGDNRSLVDVESDCKNLVALLLSNKVASEINLVSVLPINESEWEKEGLTLANIKRLNTIIKTIAKENNFNFVDISSSFADKNGQLKNEFTTDGLHLGEIGYQKYAEVIRKFINTSNQITK